jgi:hypothetical protein
VRALAAAAGLAATSGGVGLEILGVASGFDTLGAGFAALALLALTTGLEA